MSDSKLNNEFNRLMDRYNKSKTIIDQLYTSEKENNSFSKNDKVKVLNKELKITLQEYIDRCNDLEQKLENKERLIKQLQQEAFESQNAYLRSVQESREQNFKEDDNKRIIDDLNNKNLLLQSKVDTLQQQVITYKNNQLLNEETHQFKYELERVQKLCEKFSLEIESYEKENYIYKEDNSRLQKELNDKTDQLKSLESSAKEERNQLMDKVEIYQNKMDEFKDLLQVCDSKYIKMKNKWEDDKIQLKSDFEQQLSIKKDKIKQQKQEISNLETQLNNLEKENQKLKRNHDQVEFESQKISQNTQQLISDLEQANQELLVKNDRLSNSEKEFNKLKLIIQQLEVKIQQDEEYQNEIINENQQLKNELENLDHNILNQKRYFYEMQNDLELNRQQSKDEINMLEKRVDQLMNEISNLKNENVELRKKNGEYKREQLKFEESLNSTKSKYKKIKEKYKQADKQLKYYYQTEEKIRQIEQEKINVITQIKQEKQQHDQQKMMQEKRIRVLDGIQGLIRDHKEKRF